MKRTLINLRIILKCTESKLCYFFNCRDLSWICNYLFISLLSEGVIPCRMFLLIWYLLYPWLTNSTDKPHSSFLECGSWTNQIGQPTTKITDLCPDMCHLNNGHFKMVQNSEVSLNVQYYACISSICNVS